MSNEEYPLAWCKMCECYMVLCNVCGQNTCSGGYGEVNGERCTSCPDAYAYDAARDKSLEPPPGPGITAEERFTMGMSPEASAKFIAENPKAFELWKTNNISGAMDELEKEADV